ncbi:MAG: phosphotransferase family protein [Aestuariivirgaceae bacterium]
MNRPQDVTAEFVRNEVLADFDDSQSIECDWNVTGPVLTTRNCWIFKATAGRYPGGVAVKIYRLLKRPRQIVWYAAALRKYSEGMPAEQGLAVPKVLHVQPKKFAMIMEWVDGRLLRQVLLMTDVTPQQRAQRIERCGAWLRKFHELSDIKVQPFDHFRMVALTRRRIRNSPGFADYQESGDWLARAQAILDRHGELFDGEDVPYSTVHGDVTTTNLLINGQAIYGLDFDARHRRPIAGDICRLLVHLDVCRYFLTPRRAMDQAASDRRDVEALRQGYGADLFPSGRFYSFVQLNEVVRRIAVRSDDNASQGFAAGRHLELYRLNRRGRILVENFERELPDQNCVV